MVEHIGNGKDVVLIAGCGWGKSLVYFLPLILWNKGVVVIVSPLRAIMTEQNEKLKELGIKSTCLMGGGRGETVTDGTIAELKKGSFRAVFMTPEIMFENKRLQGLWYSKEWHSQLLAIVLDEAHCVYLWGNDFRKHYAQLGSLRPKLPRQVAFVALSATLPPDVLEVVKRKVGFATDVSVINIGNDRPNIQYIVRRIQAGNRYHSLDFLLEDTRKTIVYFNSLSEAKDAYDYLITKLGSSGTAVRLAGYYSVLSEGYKTDAMKGFSDGQVQILLATEAAGMGCDVSDVIRVVQFGAPPCILTLVQRLGRAARNPNIQGFGILLYSAQQVLGNLSDQRVQDFIATMTCRREVLNNIFANQPPPNERCCDLCHSSPDLFGSKPLKRFQVTYMTKAIRRTQEEIELIRIKLQEWRSKTNKSDYLPRCPFVTDECVLDDETIDKLIDKFSSTMTPQDIPRIFKWTPRKVSYYDEVATIIETAGMDAERARRRTASRETQEATLSHSKQRPSFQFVNATAMDFNI